MTINYLHEMSLSQERHLKGTNGLSVLTFCEVEVDRE